MDGKKWAYLMLLNVYKKSRKGFFSLLTCISPTLNTKVRYREVFHKPLSLENPVTFHEKLLWLKLYKYNHDPLIAQCADKYAVREYVKACGCENLLNELHGVYDSVDEIVWEDLPNQFVLKWNFGSGMNIICSDKSQLNPEKIIERLRKWGNSRYWLTHSEMQYKYIPKKVICEAYLEDEKHTTLPDYKVYCFHGEPLAVLVVHDRGGNIRKRFFDTDWNELDLDTSHYASGEKIPKPNGFADMMRAAKRLSAPFPFVRCDFYAVQDKVFFGELTFTPAGGLYTSQTNINGKDMAEYLILEK